MQRSQFADFLQNLNTVTKMIAEEPNCFSNVMAKSARLGKLNLDTARIPEHEADVMSGATQKYLLSKLDASEPVPNPIWIFACNAVGRLEERFLSRCSKLPDFNSYGASEARVTVSNALAP